MEPTENFDHVQQERVYKRHIAVCLLLLENSASPVSILPGTQRFSTAAADEVNGYVGVFTGRNPVKSVGKPSQYY